MKRISIAIILLTLCCLAIPASADVLFYEDFENALDFGNDWYWLTSSTGYPEINSTESRNGSNSCRFALQWVSNLTYRQEIKYNGNDINGSNQFEFDETYWLGWSEWVPSSHQDSMSSIMFQMHATRDQSPRCQEYDASQDSYETWRNPVFAFYESTSSHSMVVRGEHKKCEYGTYTYSDTHYLETFASGTWNDWVFQWRPAYNATGKAKVWRNGKLLLDLVDINTAFNDCTPTDKSGLTLRFAIYAYGWKGAGAPEPADKYIERWIDDFRIGDENSSYEEISPLSIRKYPSQPTAWSNNYTNNNSKDISAPALTNINFNATFNRSPTSYIWKLNGVNQSYNNEDNITVNFTDSYKINTIEVVAVNANGTSNETDLLSMIWNVTVIPLTSWWNSDYNKLQVVTVHHEYISGAQLDYPVLIDITSNDLKNCTRTDGADIVFVNHANASLLDYSVEYWNQTEGRVIAWVRISSLSGTEDTFFNMYYNYSSASNNENCDGVWDSNYKAVYHMSETPPGTVYDSTNVNNATTSGMAAENQVTGQIDGALDFDGTNEYLNVPADSSLDTGNTFTISLWAQRDNALVAAGAKEAMIVYRQVGVSSSYYTLYYNDDERLEFWMYDNNGYWRSFTGTTQVQDTNPRYITLSWDSETITTYINGTIDNSVYLGFVAEPETETLRIGNDQSASGREFDGVIDEVRISDVCRSAGWVSTGYNNTNSPGTFATYGAAAAGESVPNITSWSNNDTNNNTLSITIDTDQHVNFNATANQTITTWTWKKDTVDQSYNHDNITLSWSAAGSKNVTVTAANTNGTSSAVEWSVIVESSITWSYYKEILINHSMVYEDLTNFSVLINITDSDLSDHAQVDGDDIIFRASDKTTQLDHEQEYWNKTTGDYVGWVRVPAVNATTNTTIYMYYNNSVAVNSEDAAGVWDSNYKAVYHMSETPPGTVYDSTNVNNATTSGMAAENQVTGQIDGALDFDEVDDYIYAEADTSLDCGNNLTITTYMQRDDAMIGASAYQAMMVYAEPGISSSQYTLYWNEDERLQMWIYDGAWYSFTGTVQVQDTNPHRIDLVWNGTNAWTYIDGAQDNTGAFSHTPNNNNEVMWIGNDSRATNREFDGIIDECRISDIPRSAGWISTSYNNTKYPELFLIVGAEQSDGGAPDTKFEHWTGIAWTEDDALYRLWFECFWITSGYSDGVAPNAEQTNTQYTLRITNNGTAAGIPKIKFNESAPVEVTVYIDDDHTVAGAVVITDTYQTVAPSLAAGENVTLSAWVNLTGLTSVWEFEVYATVE